MAWLHSVISAFILSYGACQKLVLSNFGNRRTKHDLIAHQNRRRDLGIIVRLAGMHIEHELAERPFEPREPLLKTTKRAPESLAAAAKSIWPERFAELEMLLWRERVSALGPEAVISTLSFSLCRRALRRAAD